MDPVQEVADALVNDDVLHVDLFAELVFRDLELSDAPFAARKPAVVIFVPPHETTTAVLQELHEDQSKVVEVEFFAAFELLGQIFLPVNPLISLFTIGIIFIFRLIVKLLQGCLIIGKFLGMHHHSSENTDDCNDLTTKIGEGCRNSP